MILFTRYQKIIVVMILLGMMMQSNVTACEYNNKNKIDKLNEDLFEHYKGQGNSSSITLIHYDFSIEHKDISDLDLKGQSKNNFRVFLQEYARSHSNLLGVAGILSLNDGRYRGIEIFSNNIFANLKSPFDALKLSLVQTRGLTRKDYNEISKINGYKRTTVCEVGVGQYEISCDDQNDLLYTGHVGDCVGIVVRGIGEDNKKKNMLVHYNRDQKFENYLDKIESIFCKNETSVLLVSNKYTPHLMKVAMSMRDKGFNITGWSIGDCYSNFMDSIYVINVRPLSFDPNIPFYKSIFIIPGNDNIYIKDGDQYCNYGDYGSYVFEDSLALRLIEEHPYVAASVAMLGVAFLYKVVW